MSINLTPAMIVAILGGLFLLGLVAGIAIGGSRQKRKKNDSGAHNSSLRIIVEQREAGILTFEIIPAVVTPQQKDAHPVIKVTFITISVLLNILFVLLIMAALLSNPPPNEFQYKNFIPIAAQHL